MEGKNVDFNSLLLNKKGYSCIKKQGEIFSNLTGDKPCQNYAYLNFIAL